MPGVAGKKARIGVSTVAGGAGTYNDVLGVKTFSREMNGGMIDDSELSVDQVQRLVGLLDGKYTLSGNRRLADATGQNAIRDALLNDTELWVRVRPDGGVTANAGIKQQVKVSSFREQAQVDGSVEFSADLEGTGPITAVT